MRLRRMSRIGWYQRAPALAEATLAAKIAQLPSATASFRRRCGERIAAARSATPAKNTTYAFVSLVNAHRSAIASTARAAGQVHLRTSHRQAATSSEVSDSDTDSLSSSGSQRTSRV